MSIELMTAVWARGPKDIHEMVVLLALADHANDDGVCWPKMVTLARRGRMCVRTVVRVIESLETEGWLKRELRVHERAPNRKPNGGKSNRYTLNAAKLLRLTPSAIHDHTEDGYTDAPQPRDRKSRDSQSCDTQSCEIKSRDRKPHDSQSRDSRSRGPGSQKKKLRKTAAPQQPSHVTESHVTGSHVQEQSSVSTESPVLEANQEPTPLPPSRGGCDSPLALDAKTPAPTPTPTAAAEPQRQPSGVRKLDQASWAQFRLQLKQAFGDLPLGELDARFTPLVAGTSDYDAAFRDIWLVESDLDENGRPQMVVGAGEPRLTTRGFEKYRSRIQALMYRNFGFIPQVTIRGDADPA